MGEEEGEKEEGQVCHTGCASVTVHPYAHGTCSILYTILECTIGNVCVHACVFVRTSSPTCGSRDQLLGREWHLEETAAYVHITNSTGVHCNSTACM